MDNFVKEGEQFLENQEGNQNQGNVQDNQQSQQGQQDQQGGGMMKNFEQNAGDAYVNQGKNHRPQYNSIAGCEKLTGALL